MAIDGGVIVSMGSFVSLLAVKLYDDTIIIMCICVLYSFHL